MPELKTYLCDPGSELRSGDASCIGFALLIRGKGAVLPSPLGRAAGSETTRGTGSCAVSESQSCALLSNVLYIEHRLYHMLAVIHAYLEFT